MHHPVIIIGGACAGLSAAIYTARANLNPFVIEGFESGGQLMTTTEIENYPGFEHGLQGPDLMMDMRAQAERFGTEFLTEDVTQVDLTSTPKKVWVGETEYTADAVIIATGAQSKMLGLEREKELLGHGLSTCATCDGFFFKDMEIVIVGGGDSAMEEALFLTRFASHVTLIHRSDRFRASKIMLERVRENEKITIREWAKVVEILGDKHVEGVRLEDTRIGKVWDLPCQGLFLAIGHTPNSWLFADQLTIDLEGYLVTEPDRTTTQIPGVFACGDVQDKRYRQAATAAGSGVMAALDAERFLAGLD